MWRGCRLPARVRAALRIKCTNTKRTVGDTSLRSVFLPNRTHARPCKQFQARITSIAHRDNTHRGAKHDCIVCAPRRFSRECTVSHFVPKRLARIWLAVSQQVSAWSYLLNDIAVTEAVKEEVERHQKQDSRRIQQWSSKCNVTKNKALEKLISEVTSATSPKKRRSKNSALSWNVIFSTRGSRHASWCMRANLLNRSNNTLKF